jgi:hypothetical protein
LTGIQGAVTLALEPPYPDLRNILALIRQHPSLIRVVVLSQERALSQAAQIMRAEIAREEEDVEPPPTEPLLTMDIYGLLSHIESHTLGDIAVSGMASSSSTTIKHQPDPR